MACERSLILLTFFVLNEQHP